MPEERNWQLIDIVIPQNHNIISKDNEKINKYIDLAIVIRTERKVKTEVIPLVTGLWEAFSNNPKQTLMLLLVSQT